MPANDEFPNGWEQQAAQNGSGVIAGFTIAAIPGVAHVVDEVVFTFANYAAAAGAVANLGQVLFGGTVVWNGIVAVAAGINTESITFTGPKQAPVGVSVGFQLSTPPGANQWAQVDAKGHDV